MREVAFKAAARTLQQRCFEPIDIGALVYFRVVFGGLMFLELLRYMTRGQLRRVWIDPTFHFKYPGFEWVEAPPDQWMYPLAGLLLAGATGITLGLFYRVSATVFAVGFTWLFLIEAAHYLNHFYLICLLSFLAILVPANRRLAVDTWRKPSLRSEVAPAWTLWLIRFQIAIVYIYGGFAKLNADWLRGEPVRSWLMLRAETAPAVLADLLRTEWAVTVVCYGGLLFDLLIVPLLLWGKTRVLAFGCAAAFHLANNWLFSIGVFPWLGLALTALFFPPDAPRRWLGFLGFDWLRRLPAPNSAIDASAFTRRVVPVFLATYLAWQLLMPLRHFIYPELVGWTEEGQRFAWQMKLRWKYGQTRFYLSDPNTRETWIVEPDRYLTPRQVRKMNGHPDMIAQFAKHLAAIMATQGRTNVQVRAVARASLNDRAPRLIVDPNVDLARVKRGPPASWILALDNNVSEPAWSGERNSTIVPHATALRE